MKGVLICVLASGLLIVIFVLLIGVVVAGIISSFPQKEKSEKDDLTKSDIEADEEIEEALRIFKPSNGLARPLSRGCLFGDVDDTLDLMIMGVIEDPGKECSSNE